MRNKVLYFHINPVKNEIFYVGIGYRRRAYVKDRRSKFWKAIVGKYGLLIDIIEEDLTMEEAIEREKFYIKKIGRRDLGLGPLVNLTDGGEGSTGVKVSEETRLKSSKSLSGKKRTDETKKKMSEAQKGRVGYTLGKKWSEESKKRFSELRTGSKGTSPSPETRLKLSIAIKEAYRRKKEENKNDI